MSKNPQEALGQLLANTHTLQLATVLAGEGLRELQHSGAGQA